MVLYLGCLPVPPSQYLRITAVLLPLLKMTKTRTMMVIFHWLINIWFLCFFSSWNASCPLEASDFLLCRLAVWGDWQHHQVADSHRGGRVGHGWPGPPWTVGSYSFFPERNLFVFKPGNHFFHQLSSCGNGSKSDALGTTVLVYFSFYHYFFFFKFDYSRPWL